MEQPAAAAFEERGQPCPPVRRQGNSTRGQSCPRSCGLQSGVALRLPPHSKSFAARTDC